MLPTATKSTTLFSLATFKQWMGLKANTTKTISSLTSVGTVATAVCASHGYATNTFVQIAGAVQSAYNGYFLVTVIDANTFTFTIASSTTSPATGTPTVTIDDGRYAVMADDATAEIERELDLYFVTRTVTETFSGDGKTARALSNSPVGAITTFTIDGSAVAAANYVLDADTGIITFTSGGFSSGIKNVVVTYTAGYDVQDGAALPSDIVRAALDLGKAIHDELVANAIAASTVSLGPSTMVIKPSAYPASVKRVLDSWSGAGMRV
jgi:hypothetical protein